MAKIGSVTNMLIAYFQPFFITVYRRSPTHSTHDPKIIPNIGMFADFDQVIITQFQKKAADSSRLFLCYTFRVQSPI
jgi:hypothetical protein